MPNESSGSTYQLFNLKTMSGVHPGSRTAVMQRLRLLPLAGTDRTERWARLLWYDDPPACELYLQAEGTEQWQEQPLLRIARPLDSNLGETLQQALAEAGWRPGMCGSCQHWVVLAEAANEDGIPLGQCTWGDVHGADADSDVSMPPLLRRQSLLALGCPQWTAMGDEQEIASAAKPEDASPERGESTGTERSARGWVRSLLAYFARSQPRSISGSDRIVERSGVGAGTEPCFACQGRIANLGALTVATDEDDKRTFSVWRCRRCHAFYLNDWIDRWERLDSLETEEIYYRLAPAEAVDLLARFDGVSGGEHPAGRHGRSEQRQWLEEFVRNRPRLSHQIRQGR